jgi:hypothetical protein
MALCSNCRKRKAKRACPALGSRLCNLCCGILREKEIHCLRSCRYLAEHKPYQEKRIIEKKPAEPLRPARGPGDLAQDERLGWLVLHIEAPVTELAERQPSLSDKDVLLGLDYAREKLEKETRIVLIPGEEHKPKNAVGEAVLKSIEACRFEPGILISTTGQGYKKEEKLICLDRVIQTVKRIGREDIEGRAYIDNLAARFSRLKDVSKDKKIIAG